MTDNSYGQSRSWAGKITSPKSRAAAGRLLGAAGLVALAYYAGARIGFALTLKPSPVSTLWPPNSILLAAFLLTPSGCWWALVLGAFVAHLAVQLQSGIPLPMVLGWFVSNSSEALIGATIIRHFIKGPLHFESFRQVGVFVVGAALIGNFVSSFLDAGFVSLVGWGRAGYWDVWVTRTASNALASLTLVPVIVTWARSNRSRVRALRRSRYIEAGILAAGLFAACILAFGGRSAGSVGAPTLLYTPLPFLIWAAIRFGPRGTSTCLLFVAVLAVWATVRGQGPFVSQSPEDNALSIQLFLTVFSIPLLTLAAVVREREQAERFARESEDRLNLALCASQTGTWEWRIADDALSMSLQSRRILGLDGSQELATMHDFLRVVSPEDRALVAQAVLRSVQERSAYDCEFRTQRGVRWVHSKGEVIDDNRGAPERLVAVNVDITERKRAEAMLREQQVELAHLNRVTALGELSGALAHELNQPLAAILANARAAQRMMSLDRPDLGGLREILEDIALDDKRASDVITRLRGLLKKGESQTRAVKVDEVVGEVLSLLRSDLTQRGVSANTQLAENLPAARADRVQLQQVLLNLIFNACDEMAARPPGERQVTIATTRTAGGAIQLCVSDLGGGIPESRLNEIFEPFVTTKEKGLGLGLAVCRSIVTAHGGRMWAVNNAGPGATFVVELIAAETEGPPGDQVGSVAQRGTKELSPAQTQ